MRIRSRRWCSIGNRWNAKSEWKEVSRGFRRQSRTNISSRAPAKVSWERSRRRKAKSLRVAAFWKTAIDNSRDSSAVKRKQLIALITGAGTAWRRRELNSGKVALAVYTIACSMNFSLMAIGLFLAWLPNVSFFEEG